MGHRVNLTTLCMQNASGGRNSVCVRGWHCCPSLLPSICQSRALLYNTVKEAYACPYSDTIWYSPSLLPSRLICCLCIDKPTIDRNALSSTEEWVNVYEKMFNWSRVEASATTTYVTDKAAVTHTQLPELSHDHLQSAVVLTASISRHDVQVDRNLSSKLSSTSLCSCACVSVCGCTSGTHR